MPKRLVDLQSEKPLLDLVSYGHPSRPLTPHQRQQIRLLVRNAPEVMVRVTGGARTVGGVKLSMSYIGREGALGLETDGNERVAGKHFERELVADWDLDLDARPRQSARGILSRKTPKLVHNVFFSMPPGTDPQKVLGAVRKLAANEWQFKHRYAMALHTDEAHPHVHVILKARDEQGVRLNIRKATLRSWRSQFAANLRELGVDAKATERAVRGMTRDHKPTGIYRAAMRSESTFVDERERISGQASSTSDAASPGSTKMITTREAVNAGFREILRKLRADGDHGLARDLQQFMERMPQVQTEQEILRAKNRSHSHLHEFDAP